MHDPNKKRATAEERVQLKDELLDTLRKGDWVAVDVGEVMLGISAAMLKASDLSEEQFLEYARKVWRLQQPAARSN